MYKTIYEDNLKYSVLFEIYIKKFSLSLSLIYL